MSVRVIPRMFPERKMSCASPLVALAMSRMPIAAASAYAMPMLASGGSRLCVPPANSIAASKVTISESATGWLVRPNASMPKPARKSASAMPAEEICASAAPTNTIRRSTT